MSIFKSMGPRKTVDKASNGESSASPKATSVKNRGLRRSITPIKPFSFKTDGRSDKERRISANEPASGRKSPAADKSPKVKSRSDAVKIKPRASEKEKDAEETDDDAVQSSQERKSTKLPASKPKAPKSLSHERRRSEPRPPVLKRRRSRPAVDYVLLAGRRRVSVSEPAPAAKAGRKRPREEDADDDEDYD